MRKRRLKVVLASVVAGAAVLAFASPALAYRMVDISNPWGRVYGKIWHEGNKTIGYNYTIKDKARDGHCVYTQWKGIRDNNFDTDWFRLSRDVCGKGHAVSFWGTRKVISWYSMGADGFRIRLCKNINNRPDKCSRESVLTRRGKSTRG